MDGDDGFATADGWPDEVGEVKEVGRSGEKVEGWPAEAFPCALSEASGNPADRALAGSVDGEGSAFALEVEVEEVEVVVAGLLGKVVNEHPGIASDAGALGDGGLDVDADVHSGSVNPIDIR